MLDQLLTITFLVSAILCDGPHPRGELFNPPKKMTVQEVIDKVNEMKQPGMSCVRIEGHGNAGELIDVTINAKEWEGD